MLFDRPDVAAFEPLEPRRFLTADMGGAYGVYYDDVGFRAIAMERNDAALSFDFGDDAPIDTMGADSFSARWRSTLVAPTAGQYRFAVETDGRADLKVRGLATSEGPITLRRGQAVDLELDYEHAEGDAFVRVLVDPPGPAGMEPLPEDWLKSSFAPDVEFTNPTVGSGADPFVTTWGDQYVYVRSDGRSIHVAADYALQDVFAAPSEVVFTPPRGTLYSENVWAPEIHQIDGKWWIYFAADDGDNANHRMYALESAGSDPAGPYAFRGKVAADTDRWAIDGTVLEHGGRDYFVWSGWEGTSDGRQDLYIAEMTGPTTLAADRVRISTPTQDWERHGLAINEGPQVLQDNGATHIVYSASGFWTPDYAMGRLTLVGDDPLDPADWGKLDGPAFAGNAHTVGVGHGSFVESPDGREWWMAYHAHDDPDGFTGNRDVRLQPIDFDGPVPDLGEPVAPGVSLDQPAGTPILYDLPAPPARLPSLMPVKVFGFGDTPAFLAEAEFGVSLLDTTQTQGQRWF